MAVNRIYPLNDDWRLLDGNKENRNYHNQLLPDEAVPVQLPCFTMMYLEDHVGISWFEKQFELTQLPDHKQKAVLCFQQADFRAEVSVNGCVLGVHVGCEDPFSFDVTKCLKLGQNRIAVRISKPHWETVDGYTFDEVPHRNQTVTGLQPGSCYNETGISGEVTLKILPRVTVDDLYLTADAESGQITAELTADAPWETEALLILEARLAPDGDVEVRLELPLKLCSGSNTVKQILQIENHRLWDVNDPVLYYVRAELRSEFGIHSVTKKTGFRSFVVGEDGYFYLNGQRIYLRCSHTGNCMPESTHHIARDREILRRDFLMAKAAGFNMLRFISGAALPIQLDLCDEIGLMVYEEPVASWLTKDGSHAVEIYNHDLLSMVRRDRSHPSVTVWGLLNETPSTAPHDQACLAARDALPALRDLDETRLVLFSSGRWDRLDNGSVANPGSRVWQKLWGNEEDGVKENEDQGDIHFYPYAVPLGEGEKNRMRTFGKGMKKPVFVSESGVGSALDTISLVRWFEQRDYTIDMAPDVKMIRKMNDTFLAEIEKYGFGQEIPFPSALMRGSFRNHAYYRTQAFDQLRANPNICGISLTGLLDHSICGEGLWTLHRKFKPMIADVLQDGFSPLRWCVFLSAPALWPGQDLTVEAVLATEDVLKVGKEYEVRAGVLNADGPIDIRTYRFTVTAEQAKCMSVPVFTDTWKTENLAAGEYEFVAELCAGGEASGGVYKFHICPRAVGKGTVFGAGLTEREIALVKNLGYDIQPLEDYRPGGVILAGIVDETLAAQLRELLEKGAYVVAAHAGEAHDGSLLMLPQERRPALDRAGDWLYHRETVLRHRGRFFEGMQTGLADALLYTGVVSGCHMDATGVQVPDETDSFAFSTGYPNPQGYIGGYKLGSYRVGKGELVINTFTLLETAETVPYAAQMLCNILNYGMNKNQNGG